MDIWLVLISKSGTVQTTVQLSVNRMMTKNYPYVVHAKHIYRYQFQTMQNTYNDAKPITVQFSDMEPWMRSFDV